MTVNKKVFLISCVACIISLIGIIPFSIFQDNIVCVILNNICISLFSGAVLSAVVSYVNFKHIQFTKNIEFITSYIKYHNIILELINWFNHKSLEIDYSYKFIESISNEDNSNLKIKNEEQNKTYVIEFFQYIKRLSSFNFDIFFNIIDDYCTSIVLYEKFKKNSIRSLMKDILIKLKRFDYITSPVLSSYIQRYEEGLIPEYALYKSDVFKYYESIAKIDKLQEIDVLVSELEKTMKVNSRISKIYNNKKDVETDTTIKGK